MGVSFLLADTDGIIKKKELTTLTKGCGEVKREPSYHWVDLQGKVLKRRGRRDHAEDADEIGNRRHRHFYNPFAKSVGGGVR
jgi:hypothetical protein